MTQTMWPPLNASLPDALTWEGDTGRTWTLTGSDLTMDYPEGPRSELATAILTAVGDGVQVYSYPPEVPAPPAVVIKPADPYQTPMLAGGTDTAAYAYELDIIVGRNWAGGSNLDALERAREVVSAALPAGWRWVDFADIGEIIINKKSYLRGSLGVAVTRTEGLA